MNVREKFLHELKSAETLQDVFNACTDNYDLNKKLSITQKVIVVKGISTAIDLISPNEKKSF